MVSEGQDDDAFAAGVIETALPMDNNPSGLCKHDLGLPNDYGFTHVLFAPANFHSYFKGRLDAEREQLVLCLPIHDCEFSGDESQQLFVALRQDIVETLNWRRSASPRAMVRFENPETGGGTVGRAAVPLAYPYLVSEVEKLDGIAAGFIDVTNFRGDRARVLSPAANVFTFHSQESAPRESGLQEVQTQLWRFLTGDPTAELEV